MAHCLLSKNSTPAVCYFILRPRTFSMLRARCIISSLYKKLVLCPLPKTQIRGECFVIIFVADLREKLKIRGQQCM